MTKALTKPARKTPAKRAPKAAPLPVTATPMDMLDKAVTSGAVVETIEKLMTLQERWERNKARRAFDAAMSDAKRQFPEIKKSATVDYEHNGTHTNYNYEDLAGIARAVDPVLAEFGLSYRFRSNQDGNNIKVTCIIAHRDGYREETTLAAQNDNSGGKNAIQAVGSAATYLQRYTLKLALGLAAAQDDDAQATHRENTRPQNNGNGNQSRTKQRQTVTPSQFCDLRDKALEAQISEQLVCKNFRAASFEMFPADRFEAAIKKLDITIRARAAHEEEGNNRDLPNGADSDGTDAPNFNQERDNADLGCDRIPY
jgi:ERF superfamily protein